MNSKTDVDKITIDSKNFQKFTLSDNKREVHVGRKFGTKLAIAGSDNDNFVGFVTGCIGQNGLKPDVRYCARQGQFFEMFDR